MAYKTLLPVASMDSHFHICQSIYCCIIAFQQFKSLFFFSVDSHIGSREITEVPSEFVLQAFVKMHLIGVQKDKQ